jgi:hypothetical protein
MYIALILAVNNQNFEAWGMVLFVVIGDYDMKPCGIGIRECYERRMCKQYCKLLDHYDFDVSNLQMKKITKKYILEYREKIYGGKLIKAAVKT